MANQITHIVLAKKTNLILNFKENEFLIGTVFPDIRHLKVIERDKTHFSHTQLETIGHEKNSFLAGMKYHSFVDETRENYMKHNDIYAIAPKSEYAAQALKCLEDELFYDQINNWREIHKYFQNVLSEQIAYGISEKNVRKWHGLLQNYFKQSPNDYTRHAFITGIGFSENMVTEINGLVLEMKNNPKIMKILENFCEYFKSLMK